MQQAHGTDNNVAAASVSQADDNGHGGKETSPRGSSDTMCASVEHDILDYSPAISPVVTSTTPSERRVQSRSAGSVSPISPKTGPFSPGIAEEMPPRSVESPDRSSHGSASSGRSRRLSASSNDTVSSVASSSCLRANKRSRKRVEAPAADMQHGKDADSVGVEHESESEAGHRPDDQEAGSAVIEDDNDDIHGHPADATAVQVDGVRQSSSCGLNFKDPGHPGKSAKPPDVCRFCLRLTDSDTFVYSLFSVVFLNPKLE